MATIKEIVTQIQSIVGALDGIKSAPSEPPTNINQFPFSVAYPGIGSFEYGAAGEIEGNHNIYVEIHAALKADVAAAYLNIVDYVDTVPAAIMAQHTLSGKIDVQSEISYEFLEMEYGSTTTLGWRFQITLVARKDIS